jgi:hypothetical protein
MRQATARKSHPKEKPMNAEPVFYIVHPLDDVAEEKRDPAGLGRIQMTRTVRWSLIALRSYLVLMMLLVGYQFLNLAGVVHFGR